MPKRRPIFEFKGLSGFLGSAPSHGSNRSGDTDESPRPPSVTLSSRYQSPPRHHRRSRRSRNRHKPRKHHHSRRAHYVEGQRYRQSRYEDSEGRIPRFADEEPRDSEFGRSPHSDVLRTPASGSRRSPMNYQRRHPGSPPPYDPHTRSRHRSPSAGYPHGTRLSPEHESDTERGSGAPSGYLGKFDRAGRAVDASLEHSFSPTGLPDDEAGHKDVASVGSFPRQHLRTHRRHKHYKHRGHKRASRRRRRRRDRRAESIRRNRDDSDDEHSEDGRGEGDDDSEEEQLDEDGNIIESETHGIRRLFGIGKKQKGGGKKKKGRKRRLAKILALALGAVVVGLVAKKIIAKRKKKKAEQEAQAAAVEQEEAGPFDGVGGKLFAGSNPLQLPLPKTSLSVKVPETEAFIVERGGRYNRRLNPGSNILLPFVDRVAYRFSLKEISLAVPEQQCQTRENASVTASALLFAKVEDAVAAAYGVDDARRSLMLLAQTCMRKEIARLSVEQMLQDRDGLGHRILRDINKASRPWGIRCTRFEIRDLEVPEQIRMALDRQAQVERQARADVIASQGARDAMKNRADGEMHAQMRMSQARQINTVNQAIGEAHAISERGEAIAGAMRDVAEVLKEPGGEKAMQMRIAEQYIHSYANATANQDHLPPPPNPADMAAAISSAMGLVESLGQPGSTAANPQLAPGPGSNGSALPQQQGSVSQSGDETRPPPTASKLSGLSQGASSHQQSDLGTPSSHGGSDLSHGSPQGQTAMVPHVEPSPSQYAGPIYPQAPVVGEA